MNALSRRGILKLGGAALALASAPPGLAQQPPARVDFEYFVIEPQPVPAGPRVDVVEFFWYGCPFCNELQPFLEGWLKRKPDDINFRRMPAVFRESWVPGARLFHTLEALGELDRLHQTVYRTIHIERQSLNSAEAAAEWAARQGIDRGRWIDTYKSRETDKKVEQSIQATRSYGIKGTPSLVVDGRYVTSTGMSESVSGVIGILDDLVRIARDRRALG
jgi:thiol:disulfide interchange protein DsbA